MSGQESEINGSGYGDGHCWLRVFTPQAGGAPIRERRTYYLCRRCGAKFTHFYACAPDIFEAMRDAGVRDACAEKSTKANPGASETSAPGRPD